MKTIAIDCRFAAIKTGLGRYTYELVTHLLKEELPFRVILIVRNKNEPWIPAGAIVKECDAPHYSWGEQIKLPRLLKQLHVDLFFSPHFNVPLLCPIPYVVTIHDLILHRYPNQASWIRQKMYRFLISHAVRDAQSVITVSDFVKRELCEMYGPPLARKLCIIREGVSSVFVPQSKSAIASVRKKYDMQKSYFLYVGNAKEHKNVPLLLSAFTALGSHDREFFLIASGKEALSLSLPQNVKLLQNIPDEDLPALYSGADTLLTASLYEGYCLPVAEAQACGCPVIASNKTAIPEVAGPTAMLIDPTKEAFIAAMKNPPTDRTQFRAGTWSHAAKETVEHLLQILH